MKETEFRKELIKKLDELSAKVDALIQVVAITSREETVLKGKTKTDQIKRLYDLGLSSNLIALIVGSTPGSVSARLSQLKAKRKKSKKKEEVEDAKR